MGNVDKLRQDIETLLESIRQDWEDVAEGRIDRQAAVKHVEWCIQELQRLIEEVEGGNA